MGVHKARSTLAGGVTPICNGCGVSLCWDISDEDYAERPEFWDNWRCRTCVPRWRLAQAPRTSAAPEPSGQGEGS